MAGRSSSERSGPDSSCGAKSRAADSRSSSTQSRREPSPPRSTVTHREDEYSYVLEGRLGALLGDDVVYAEAGDLAFKPRDQWHTFWNAGDTVCRILEIISPAGFEHYFDDFAEAPESRKELGARYGLEVDLDRVAELCEEHGLRFPRPTDGRGPSD